MSSSISVSCAAGVLAVVLQTRAGRPYAAASARNLGGYWEVVMHWRARRGQGDDDCPYIGGRCLSCVRTPHWTFSTLCLTVPRGLPPDGAVRDPGLLAQRRALVRELIGLLHQEFPSLVPHRGWGPFGR